MHKDRIISVRHRQELLRDNNELFTKLRPCGFWLVELDECQGALDVLRELHSERSISGAQRDGKEVSGLISGTQAEVVTTMAAVMPGLGEHSGKAWAGGL
ncbi:hypothetical protein D3C78_1697160 [compost metagenome]